MAREIRPLCAADLPQVVDLFGRVFRDGRPLAADTAAYFGRIFLEHPWADPHVGSLVCLDGARVAGFLGVVPRPFRLHGKPLLAASMSTLMVDPADRSGGVLLPLATRFFRGRQDFSITDTATDESRRVLQVFGCRTVRLYSLRWLRVLRPAAFAASRARRRLSALAAVRPLAAAADWAARPLLRCAALPRDCREAAWDVEQLAAAWQLPQPCALAPEYSRETLGWLLETAALKRDCGRLQGRMLYDAQDQLLGWHLSYCRRGEMARVLQFYSRAEAETTVLDSLIRTARDAGAAAVSGRVHPPALAAYSQRRCLMYHAAWMLVHSEKHNVHQALAEGNTYFSGLEGEEWMRMIGDSFS
jgi:hypothetical protein